MTSIFSWNVNGIRAVIRKGAFDTFLQTHDPDILCLQETKANPDQVDIDFSQYHEYWNGAEKKGYSGTAIFSKEKPIEVFNNFHPSVLKTNKLLDEQERNAAKEGRIVTAEYKNFYVMSVYTPNAKGDLSRLQFKYKKWDPLFLEHIQELEKNKPVIFCGDINVAHNEIDLARPKDNVGKHGFTQEEREGFQRLLDAGFIDTYRDAYPDKTDAYTWWSHWGSARARNVGWRIDYVCASKKLKKRITNPAIHPDMLGSDHCPVSIEIK